MSVVTNGERSPSLSSNHANTSVKSVTFAPLESTRCGEEGYSSDNHDIDDFHYREPSPKILETVRICDLDDLVEDVPIKKTPQPSLESRDNPFKPDGELCKEAEDILKRATIIRDTFILNENRENDASKTNSRDTANGDSPGQHAVQEEAICQTSVSESKSSPVSIQPKQNGVEDKKVSPDSVNVDVDSNAVNDVSFKDKKKQKKCCNVM